MLSTSPSRRTPDNKFYDIDNVETFLRSQEDAEGLNKWTAGQVDYLVKELKLEKFNNLRSSMILDARDGRASTSLMRTLLKDDEFSEKFPVGMVRINIIKDITECYANMKRGGYDFKAHAAAFVTNETTVSTSCVIS